MRSRKTGEPYPRKQTACVCSRPGVKPISGGWICAHCLRIDDMNARVVEERIYRRGRPELWKYQEVHSHTCGGER